MAEVRWIKIVTDIFDDEKILLIESMPDADAIIVIWFKLLCLAGKTNNSGVFIMADKIPYTEEMFATIFRRNINTVRLALQTFEKFGMIKIIDNVVTIPNWGKHQSLDQLESRKEYMRRYMAEYREKQKILTTSKESKSYGKVNSKSNSKVNVNALDKNRLEEDKNRIEKNIVEDKSSMSAPADVPEDLTSQPDPKIEIDRIDYNNIMDYWNRVSMLKPITAMTDKRKGHVGARIREHGLEAVYKVIDNCGQSSFMRGNNARGWQATFDWVFLPNNFVKVLEGNYLAEARGSKLTKFEQDYLETLEELKRSGFRNDDGTI